jgi:transcriptional regulator with XRE-family HTH domain
MNTIIGSKIRKVREIKGISQQYLADKIGVSQVAVSKIEKGEIKVDDKLLENIANALEVDKETILNFSDNYVFNNCSNSGNHNTYQINPIEIIQNLNEKLLFEKDKMITLLQKRVDFLEEKFK